MHKNGHFSTTGHLKKNFDLKFEINFRGHFSIRLRNLVALSARFIRFGSKNDFRNAKFSFFWGGGGRLEKGVTRFGRDPKRHILGSFRAF